MTEDLTLDDVKRAAERAGWSLSEDELAKLLKGGLRGRHMAGIARKYVTRDTEPAGVFSARRSEDQP
jgi:hypothetical protein